MLFRTNCLGKMIISTLPKRTAAHKKRIHVFLFWRDHTEVGFKVEMFGNKCTGRKCYFEQIALENFLILHLDEGFRIAIRPSGTEPKLKFYIFGEGSPGAKVLEDEKNKVHQLYQEVSSELKKEVDQRRN